MYYFSKTLFFGFILILLANATYAYQFKYVRDVEVGNEPVGVFYDSQNNQFHIFCKGTDKNFNSKFEPDSGDVVPTWWTLKTENSGEIKEITKVKEFEFNSIPFPFRPAYAPAERSIFINHYDGIAVYNLDNYQQIGTKLEFLGVNGLDYRSGHLLISKTTFGLTVDTILVYSIAQNKVMNKYPVGKNLMYAKMFQPNNPDFKGIAAISMGNFGSDSSNLHIARFSHFQQAEFADTLIGNTANYMDIIDNKFLVVPVMLSNKFILTDLNNDSYFSTITLGEEASWDGPSFSKLCRIKSNENLTESEYLIFTTTYSGNLEIYRFSNNEFPKGGYERSIEFLNTIELKNKGEALDFSTISEKGIIQVVVANSLKPNYSANNTVSLINIEGITSAKNETKDSFFIFSDTQLKFVGSMYTNSNISIFDINGNTVRTVNNINTISTSNLSSGTYIAKYFDGSRSYLYKFNIVR